MEQIPVVTRSFHHALPLHLEHKVEDLRRSLPLLSHAAYRIL